MQHTIKRLSAWAVIVAGLLLIPLTAMQFTEEVDWTLTDFIAMAALLFGAGLVYVPATRKADIRRRLATGIAVAAGFIYLWAELAVGIFTNWGS